MADDLPYRFPEGLRVFVLHPDNIQLKAIADLCYQCNYEVTTCVMASYAVHFLRETKGFFDIILLDAQMPDMDSYDFLQRVTQEIKIPIIMMGFDHDHDHDSTSAARREAFQKGACDYWLKPINENHINNMWQHVVTIQQEDQICRILEVKTRRKIRKIGSDDQSATKLETNASVPEKNSDNDSNYQPPRKKNRVRWSPNLHENFLRVVNQLGGFDNAKPRQIVKLMDDPDLTIIQVASHLQKFRVCSKRPSKKTKLKNKMPKCEEKISKQDQCQVPNESLQVVHPKLPEQDQNIILNSATECGNNVHAQQHSTLFDGFEASDIFINKCHVPNEDLEVVQPMSEQEQNVVLDSATECGNNFHAQQHSTPFDGFEASNIFTNECHVPNEGLEVVQPMPEHDQNVVLNSAIECANNIYAQQHTTPLDGFEASNIFTNECHVPNEDLEVVQPMSEQEQNVVQNSAIESGNNFHVHQHSPPLDGFEASNIFTNECHVSTEGLEVVQPMSEQDQNVVLDSPIECANHFYAQQHTTPLDGFEGHEVVQPMSEQDQNVVLNSATECGNNFHAQQHSTPFDGFEASNISINESLEVVLPMPDQDQNVALNSAAECADNFHAQQHSTPIDDFETSNIFTIVSNMIQDDPSSLYDACYPSEDDTLFGLFQKAIVVDDKFYN